MRYLEQYKQIHENKKYGVSGNGHVEQLSRYIPGDASSLLDYGAGQATTGHLLAQRKGIADFVAYDPAVVGRDEKPVRDFDVVICTDVLEHVPEEEINEVLLDIWAYADLRAIFIIATGPAAEILPNGENAHCTQHDGAWWRKRLSSVFRDVVEVPMNNNYWVMFFCEK